MPTYDGTYKLAVEDGRVLIRDVEGGSQSTHVPLEIYSNYAAQGTLTDSRQLRLRTQPYLESNTANAYVTDMGIESGQTDNYFFITAPQKTANVGDRSTFVISKTSNVGIGTTDPTKPLHVVGDSWITGTLTASNIIGASPVTISSNLVMASGFTLTAGAIEPPTGSESNLRITGTITTSNITHDSELTITSNLLMGSDKTLTTSNLIGSPSLTVTANTNVVAEFTESSRYYNVKEPRSAMTANSSFGYTASASSDYQSPPDYEPWEAFNGVLKNTSYVDSWISATGTYNTGTGVATTTDSFNGVNGSWLKIQLPTAIKLLTYTIHQRGVGYDYSNPPKKGKLYGSTNGNTWSEIDSFDNLSFTSSDYLNISVNNENYYSYFLIHIEEITVSSGGQSYVAIQELELYGTPYTAATNDGTSVIFKTVPNTPKTDFLKVYYDDFTSAPATLEDKTANSFDSSKYGTVGFDSTYKALTFNGTSGNYYQSSSSIGFSGDQPHTIACWVKLNVDQTSLGAGRYDPFYLGKLDGGNNQASAIAITSSVTYWYNYNNDLTVSSSVFSFKAGQWVHVVFSYVGGGATPSNKSIYFNGQKYTGIQSGPYAGNVINFDSTDCYLKLGGGAGTPPTSPLNGSIANYRLYDRPLSADEVWELYGYQKAYFSVSPDVVTYKAGRVGIGTSEPSAVLDVVGGANISGGVGIGTTSSSYKLHVAGDIYATGNITGYSDERAKSDIQKIENALEKIEKLNGYTFTMNNKRYTGMIAQEVLQVLPEAVVGTEETEYALAYGNMMGLIVEGIKEIKKKLDM